jgi:hypothetical protein
LATDGVAMVPSSLRDEMVWQGRSADAERWKLAATFGGRFATRTRTQSSRSFFHSTINELLEVTYATTPFNDLESPRVFIDLQVIDRRGNQNGKEGSNNQGRNNS